MRIRWSKIFSSLLLPFLVVMLWEMGAIYLEKPSVLPRVGQVLVILVHPFAKVLTNTSLFDNICVSLARVMMGFTLAVVIAVPLGVFMGRFSWVKDIVEPLVELLRPVPPLAWVPLILAWTGIISIAEILSLPAGNMIWGNMQLSMLIIIIIGVFFPVLLNTIHGVQSVSPLIIGAAQTEGATEIALLLKIIVPLAFPSILTGIRIGLGIGWMCVVAAEMLPGSTAGLGYLIWYAHELLRTDVALAGIIIIGLIGTAFDKIFHLIEHRCFSWVE
ncbi:NitT/TauT family transport system permease protein [Thermanaeromonas toyohensis ToBE]|uniref:NitT/TauT family transport system permease protein n=1 Tax=Thermanaeromonas toyohensis ToBE TaxID=698762 RepID=A0A1W1W1E6_9FIRM|nr:ABC transporter permease [Thermanaeromonas toyohensis]SMB99310.1 NitT/TauT family transport system permease protein [Thermanaeromonas toyohensis ToBE]